MKSADTTTPAAFPGPPPYDIEDSIGTEARARKAHAADAAKLWRWIRIRLRPGMSDDEIRGLVLSVLREKQPQLEAEAGIVERLTAAALRHRHAGSGHAGSGQAGSPPPPKPHAARRALSYVARIPARRFGLAALALVALLLAIDPVMTAFILAVVAPFAALFAILRALRVGGGSGGCSGGSCGVARELK